jgi:hypothetical protein
MVLRGLWPGELFMDCYFTENCGRVTICRGSRRGFTNNDIWFMFTYRHLLDDECAVEIAVGINNAVDSVRCVLQGRRFSSRLLSSMNSFGAENKLLSWYPKTKHNQNQNP